MSPQAAAGAVFQAAAAIAQDFAWSPRILASSDWSTGRHFARVAGTAAQACHA